MGLRRLYHGPLTRYVKCRDAHGPGIPGTFFPPPTSKEFASLRSRHASRHVNVGMANPRWRGKRSRHSRRIHNPQFTVFGKRPITQCHKVTQKSWLQTTTKNNKARSVCILLAYFLYVTCILLVCCLRAR